MGGKSDDISSKLGGGGSFREGGKRIAWKLQ